MVGLLLALQALSGHVDEQALNAYADSLKVPRQVVWAVAYMETRTGRQGNKPLGPGVVDTIWVHDTLKIVRKCREVGRMQLRPCGNFTHLLGPRCSPALLKQYDNNVWCGVSYLHYLHYKYGTWEDAIWHYNGDRHKYLNGAMEYLGRLYLRINQWDAETKAPRTY